MALERTRTILVINIHAALDRIFFIDRFVPDAHMRAKKALECIGGKGLDTAVVLKELGAPLRAVTFIAGANGQILARLLIEKGINSELLWVDGETRVANVIVETENQCHSHITTTGYHVDRTDCDRLLEIIQNLGRSCSLGRDLRIAAAWRSSNDIPGNRPGAARARCQGADRQPGSTAPVNAISSARNCENEPDGIF